MTEIVKQFDYIRKTFGLCCAKEDTFISGLSMGGFGALHTGLAYPDTFCWRITGVFMIF
jgi:S-formylglutathione hydrolase FrmB